MHRASSSCTDGTLLLLSLKCGGCSHGCGQFLQIQGRSHLTLLPFTPSLPCSPYVHILLLSLVYLPYANSHLPPPLHQTRHSFITSIPFISKWGLLVYVSTIACPLKSGMFRSHLHLHLRMCLVPEKWLSYHKASSQKFPET